MKRYAIIVAGGKGTRMQGTLPKQFLEVSGKPVLMHTLEKFHRPGLEIILVLHPDFHAYWQEQCNAFSFNVPYTLVAGGNSRAQSVINGLDCIQNPSLIAVHDAVRPFIKTAFLERLFTEAEEMGSAIPVLPVKETMRHLGPEGSRTVNRDEYRLVQTPQVFKSEILKEAFLNPDFAAFTDEASLVEATGKFPLHLTAGEEQNIKLTVPADLHLAAYYLSGGPEL
jgi:2-C-methyl-D-erythritol 4-phosphate cytidylyltransferase